MKDIVTKVMFLPSLTYNMCLYWFGHRQWYTYIDDFIILGALPWTEMAIKLMKEENIKRVVSLNEASELRYSFGPDEWSEYEVKFLHLPTRDFFDSPSIENLNKGVLFIKDSVDKNDKVYVHCKSGRSFTTPILRNNIMTATKSNFPKLIYSQYKGLLLPFTMAQNVRCLNFTTELNARAALHFYQKCLNVSKIHDT
ncbi:hypothetical protein GJ496_008230 [Pomphorhynchus laevis]|nr:hypothetical protein GJ496_008230 [Pomphorhynchus laevis]